MEFITRYETYINPETSHDPHIQDANCSKSSAPTQNQLVNFSEALSFEFKNNYINLVLEHPQPMINIEKFRQNHYFFSFMLASSYQGIQFLFEIAINFVSCSIKINSTLMENGALISIKNLGNIQNLCRFCLNLNSRFSTVSINVNPYQGTPKIASIHHFRKDFIAQLIKRPVELSDLVYRQASHILEIWNNEIINRIFLLNNLFLPQQVSPPKSQLNYQNQNGKFSDHIKKRIQILSTIVLNSHIRYPFMEEETKDISKNSRRKNQIRFSNPLQEDINSASIVNNLHFSNFIDKKVNFRNNIEQCLKMYSNCVTTQAKKDITIQQKDIERFQQDHLSCEGFHAYPPKILSDIVIQKVESEKQFDSGGFGTISHVIAKVYKVNESVAKIRGYPSKSISTNLQLMFFAKKIAPSTKLWHEKTIVKRMGRHNCLFIQKYYNSVDHQFHIKDENLGDRQALYMDYCYKKSLNTYLSHNKAVTSLQLKIFFFYQISVALRFLRDRNIVHLDLKPENILLKSYKVPAWLVLRLIDFGQSYCHLQLFQQKSDEPFKRGFTIPYASPELIRQDNMRQDEDLEQGSRKYVEKSDVFSLGVMILSIFFDINLIEIKMLGVIPYANSGDGYTKLYNMCIQKCRYYGYQPLMMCLLNLAYKCIRLQKYSRPLLDWVCVFFKECIILLDQIVK